MRTIDAQASPAAPADHVMLQFKVRWDLRQRLKVDAARHGMKMTERVAMILERALGDVDLAGDPTAR